ncbi:MAG TPA: glycosyltransferase family 4 protein [Steroidobacteraceae bacterium]|jgi:glycosyltransferase involved in cell wall biosynthesis
MPRPLHVAQISFFNDPAGRTPATLLEAWPTLGEVAEAACAAGVRVSVVQASVHTETLTRNGVQYHFLPFGDASVSNEGAGRLAALLHGMAPELFHVHGLAFPSHVLALAQRAPGIPIVLQDHADRPPRIWRRALWRRAMARAAAITFCAPEQASPFRSAGLIGAGVPCYAIPESTSRFTPGDAEQARQLTGLGGDPALLWVGHLDANKDPLTILAGASAAARALPRLQLWCCFGTAPLGKEVRRRIAQDPMLTDRVHLLGNVSHGQVEQLMRAADIFVQGSHHESTGYSVIEALACGLTPVITDIPSFRALTGGGAVGSLWPPGDTAAYAAALSSIGARARPALRAEARAHFERELSFPALGSKLAAMYESLCERNGETHGLEAWMPHDTRTGASSGEASCRL